VLRLALMKRADCWAGVFWNFEENCKTYPHLIEEVAFSLLARVAEEIAKLKPKLSFRPLEAPQLPSLSSEEMREHFAVLDFRPNPSAASFLGERSNNVFLPAHRLPCYHLPTIFDLSKASLPDSIQELMVEQTRSAYQTILDAVSPIRSDQEHVLLLKATPANVKLAVALYRLKLWSTDLSQRPLARFVLPTRMV
jgi:hypothetical protein